MSATKRTITFERRQRTVIRHSSPKLQKFWCEFCAAGVESLAPEIAAAVFETGRREIYRLIENGTLHFIEERERDAIYICVNSLKASQLQRR